jgi:FkbM family methyltransferase
MGKAPVVKGKLPSRIRPTQKVVVLCGACRGENLEKVFVRFPNATVYAIEPEKENFKVMYDKFHKRPRLVLINKAVWIENGKKGFNVYHSPVSHSLYHKPKLDSGNKFKAKVEVETMDFAEFLSQFAVDEVLVRMDIEGAEYEVLLHCFEKGVMDNVNELHIEYHAGWRIPSVVPLRDRVLVMLQKWGKTVLSVA